MGTTRVYLGANITVVEGKSQPRYGDSALSRAGMNGG